MKSTISRRSVLGATGAAAVATVSLGGLSVAATDPTADGELLRLGAAFEEAEKRWLAEVEDYDDAHEQLDADFPVPDAPERILPDELSEFRGISHGERTTLLAEAPDHPYSVWSREYEAATADLWKAYYDARDAYRAESERRGISSRSRDLYGLVDALADEILATPAVTLAGVMVKVRLGKWFEDGDAEGMAEMHKSVAADLEAMAGSGHA